MLNVTPDSFSDGGEAFTADAAFAKAERLLAEGADVIDVGGASSRPAGPAYGAGAAKVSVAEELRRVLPVIARIHRELHARVSIDTVNAEVAEAAIEAGASIVNDVSGGASEALLRVAARHGVELVLMHNRGDGGLTGSQASYADVVQEVAGELRDAVARARAAGVEAGRVWLDPGIGFAKHAEHSFALLAALPRLVALGHPVLVGPSRKAFIAAAERAATGASSGPGERLGGTCAAVASAVFSGARAVRVHDVRASRQAVSVALAIRAIRDAKPAQEALC
ncbi:MAG TPA: dihydropteroate synthase [Polyangiales bacterium]